jgi:hypothetical protein
MRGTFAGIGILLMVLGIGSIFTAGKPSNDAGYAVALGLGLIVGGVGLVWIALSGAGGKTK